MPRHIALIVRPLQGCYHSSAVFLRGAAAPRYLNDSCKYDMDNIALRSRVGLCRLSRDGPASGSPSLLSHPRRGSDRCGCGQAARSNVARRGWSAPKGAANPAELIRPGRSRDRGLTHRSLCRVEPTSDPGTRNFRGEAGGWASVASAFWTVNGLALGSEGLCTGPEADIGL